MFKLERFFLQSLLMVLYAQMFVEALMATATADKCFVFHLGLNSFARFFIPRSNAKTPP